MKAMKKQEKNLKTKSLKLKGGSMSKPETIMINDQKYVRADMVEKPADKLDGMKYCIIRSYGAGVFAGYLKEQKSDVNGVNVVIVNSRRIWYWSGACSLSQIAVEGLKDIDNCKIAMVVPETFISNVIEIIPMTKKAQENIQGAEIWKK